MSGAQPGTAGGGLRAGTVLRVLVGVAVLGLLARAVRHEDLRAIVDGVRRASALPLVVAALANVALVWTKARRLHLLLEPPARAPTPRLMGYFFASYAADNLLMSQAGLGVRVALLAADGVPVLTGAALQALEKLLEAAGLALLALPLGGPILRAARLPRLGPLLVGAALVGAAVVALLVRWRPESARRIASAAAALRSPAVLAEVVALTLAGWLVELAMVWLTLAALGLPAGPATSTLVVVAVNVAALVPGLPTNVGTFEASAVLALGLAGVAASPALGFALLFHALHTIPVTLLGLPGLRALSRVRAPR